ncbi:MAG: BatA and WFA domain-containing protein [Chitinivibrionales bacterium]|nr:BatA and WFA domain-containing protein [Chitinivibrionales bacterium]
MHFLNPSMLFFLGLIPVVVLIHSLMPKPKRALVSTLFLWQRVSPAATRGRRIRTLVTNTSLLLQIIIITLGAFALAQPVFHRLTTAIESDIIIIVDISASMKTTLRQGNRQTKTQNRFDRCREEVRHLIASRTSGKTVTLIAAGATPAVVAQASDSPVKLLDAIDSLQPIDAPADLKKSVLTALEYGAANGSHPEASSAGSRIFLVTDGAGVDFIALQQLCPALQPIIVSGGGKNVGITRFSLREKPESAGGAEILLTVGNFSKERDTVRVSVTFNAETIATDTLLLQSGMMIDRIVSYPRSVPEPGVARAILNTSDDFSVDDTAYALFSNNQGTAQKLSVLLVSPGNFFLEKVLQSFPFVVVDTVRAIPSDAAVWQQQVLDHDVTIVDRVQFPHVDKGTFVCIDAYSQTLPFEKIGSVDFPAVSSWQENSTILADMNPADFVIEKASMTITKNRMVQTLIAADTIGLLYYYADSVKRCFFVAFDFLRSDIPLRPMFPILMHRVLSAFYPHKVTSSGLAAAGTQVQTGSTANLYLSDKTDVYTVTTPDEKTYRFKKAANPSTFDRIIKTGVYTIHEPYGQRQFAANLFDERESDIDAISEFAQAGMQTNFLDKQRKTTRGDHRTLWQLVCGLLVILLVIEWLIWNSLRR